MYKKFEQKVAKRALSGFHWWCKACSSPASEHAELDMEENKWIINRLKCNSCGQVWRRESDA